MKTKSQIKLIGLVAISLLLLLAFLLSWNIDNFRKERNELKQDLKDQMSLACSEYRDSLVQDIFRVVTVNGDEGSDGLKEPTKNIYDTLNSKLPKSYKNDIIPTTHSPAKIRRFQLLEDKNNGTKWVSIPEALNKNESNDSTNKKGINIPIGKSGNKIVVWESDKTGKLRLEYANNFEGDSIEIWHDGPKSSPKLKINSPKTNKIPSVFNTLDSIYSKKMLQNGITLQHELKIVEENTITTGSEIIIPFDYDSFGLQKVPSAIFSNYTRFLLRRIAPSILMSLLLFAVLAITFFTILQSWAKQRRLTEMKNEFVSNMTHELNTPIATIGVALEAMENFGALDDPIRKKEYLDISKQEVGRLKDLVDKVLSISTTDAAQNVLSVTTFDFKQLLEDKVESLNLHINKHNAKVQVTTKGSDFSVQADQLQLTNVIQNLIDNAIKYSNENPQIDITLESKTDQLLIKVSDQGIGIPQVYHNKIFDRFFRVPQNDRHDAKGHGLGLHFVKSIIDQHKGTIKLLPTGKGSTFLIQIPKQHD